MEKRTVFQKIAVRFLKLSYLKHEPRSKLDASRLVNIGEETGDTEIVARI